jgi:flagellar protein FliL
MAKEQKSESKDLAPRESGGPKSNMKFLVIVLVFLVVLSSGAAAWFFMHGRVNASAKTEAAKAPERPTITIHLDSFIVNLADTDQAAYLRVSLDLAVAQPGDGKKEEGKEEKAAAPIPQIRDAIIGVLSSRKSQDLLTAEGKQALKRDLLTTLNQHIPGLDARDIYFTDFLVQR